MESKSIKFVMALKACLKNSKIILLSMSGNCLEFYDFAIFGIFIPNFAPFFFVNDSEWAALMKGFMVFTIGFLARPVGAILFGHIGDRYGRKRALTLSISLMAFATFGIGVCPGYNDIGPWAPTLLVVFRLLQGISAGGEGNGGTIFVMEHTAPHLRGLSSGLVSAATISGVVLATIVAAILTRPEMPTDAWRYAFIGGAGIGLFSMAIRLTLKETPLFEETSQKNNLVKTPLSDVFRHSFKPFVLAFGMSALAGCLQLTFAGFVSIYLSKHLMLPYTDVLVINAGCLVFYACLLPVAGWLADKYTPYRLLMIATLATLFCLYFVFVLLDTKHYGIIIMTKIGLAIITALYMGSKSLAIYHLFDTPTRFTGMSLAYATGVALFGGLTPWAGSKAIELGISPAIFPIVCAFLSLISLMYIRPKTWSSMGRKS